MNAVLVRAGLSVSCAWPSDHSVSNHRWGPAIALTRYPSASQAAGFRRFGLRHLAVGSSPFRPNRVHLRYGLAIRFPLFPTPPRGDAVTVSYKPENVYLERTFTPRTRHTYRHTATLASSQACPLRDGTFARHPHADVSVAPGAALPLLVVRERSQSSVAHALRSTNRQTSGGQP